MFLFDISENLDVFSSNLVSIKIGIVKKVRQNEKLYMKSENYLYRSKSPA